MFDIAKKAFAGLLSTSEVKEYFQNLCGGLEYIKAAVNGAVETMEPTMKWEEVEKFFHLKGIDAFLVPSTVTHPWTSLVVANGEWGDFSVVLAPSGGEYTMRHQSRSENTKLYFRRKGWAGDWVVDGLYTANSLASMPMRVIREAYDADPDNLEAEMKKVGLESRYKELLSKVLSVEAQPYIPPENRYRRLIEQFGA